MKLEIGYELHFKCNECRKKAKKNVRFIFESSADCWFHFCQQHYNEFMRFIGKVSKEEIDKLSKEPRHDDKA